MATEIKMPQLSDTMNAGKILSWRKQEGDVVARGDVLAEVETDKANLEIESFHQGVLLKIVTPIGTSATVGETIAVLGTADEAASGMAVSAPPSATGSQPSGGVQLGSSVQVGSGVQVDHSAHIANGQAAKAPPVTEQPLGTSAPAGHSYSSGDGGRVRASPLAKRLAQELNVDLATIRGSGPQGRIIKKDIEAAPSSSLSDRPAGRPESSALPSNSRATAAGGRTYPLSKMRETIARRMQESVTQAPHFYVTASIHMDAAVELRERLKAMPVYKGVSVNHLIIKAVGLALRQEPRVNNGIREGQVYEPDAVNVGIITAVPDGLLIPVIREADRLPLRDVVFEARAAVERAKAGRPSSTDLTGGTFSISNMGMFDVENFTAIINPGQGAVLAVSAVQTVPVVRDNHIAIGKVMKVTLSVDHRIIDGVMGANFLKYFREYLEVPGLLLA